MAAKKTDDDRSLKRLGGGRWQTRDERFTIEPQSGTWVLVDAEQTDDLGLPLVRGPFRSLTEAKAAVEDARGTAVPESPLADRVREAGARPARTRPGVAAETGTRAGPKGASASVARETHSRVAEPESAPEPRWVADLSPRERGRARRLIERIEARGVRDAESVVRQDLTGGVPTVARLAVANQLADLVASVAEDAPAMERAIGRLVEALSAGRDDELDVRWRLADGDDRPIGLTARDIGAAIERRAVGVRKERKR
jgi:hypothetical protein